MTDAQWQKATEDVEAAVARHRHIDFGKLADQVADRYIESRQTKANDQARLGFLGGMGSAEVTASMLSSLVAVDPERARLQALASTALGFMLPCAILMTAVYGWHFEYGWYGVPMATLILGFVVLLSIAASLVASFVRGGALTRWAPPLGALSLASGAVFATVGSSIAIFSLKSSEVAKLYSTSSELSRSTLEALASTDASPINRVARDAKALRLQGLVASSDNAVSIEARGLPGLLTAKFDTPGSARVTWSHAFRPEVTQAIIKEGRVQKTAGGGALLVADDGSVYAVGSSLISDLAAMPVRAVGLIDADTKAVTHLVPIRMPAAAASSTRATGVPPPGP